jgi:hypothetical protein
MAGFQLATAFFTVEGGGTHRVGSLVLGVCGGWFRVARFCIRLVSLQTFVGRRTWFAVGVASALRISLAVVCWGRVRLEEDGSDLSPAQQLTAEPHPSRGVAIATHQPSGWQVLSARTGCGIAKL